MSNADLRSASGGCDAVGQHGRGRPGAAPPEATLASFRTLTIDAPLPTTLLHHSGSAFWEVSLPADAHLREYKADGGFTFFSPFDRDHRRSRRSTVSLFLFHSITDTS